MKIARVFPRITKATPTDELAFTSGPPMFGLDVEEVHISVAFTYDMKQDEWLEMQWRALGLPVKMGVPAFNESGSEFIPGRYLKTRVCHNKPRLPKSMHICRWSKMHGARKRGVQTSRTAGQRRMEYP